MNKRTVFGRRRSDWIVPIALVVITGLALGWAIDNRAKRQNIQRLNVTLQHTVELSDRDLRDRDAKIARGSAHPTPSAP